MKQLWTIDLGNMAVRVKLVLYSGTQLGAVRYANRLWRERTSGVSRLALSRPGCHPIRLIKTVRGKTVRLRAMQFSFGFMYV